MNKTLDTSPRKFLRSLVKQSDHLIKHHKTAKPIGKMGLSLNKIKPWVEAYPNASEQAALKIINKYQSEISFLLPGGEHPAQVAIRNRFHYLISLNNQPTWTS